MDQFDRYEMELERQNQDGDISDREYNRLMRELSLDRSEHERESDRYDDHRLGR